MAFFKPKRLEWEAADDGARRHLQHVLEVDTDDD